VPPPPTNPDRYWMVFIRSVGTLTLGIGSLMFTYLSYQTQKRNAGEQNSNAKLDALLKHKTFQFQTDLESAKMAISVIPMMSCVDDIKRASALQVLDNFSPIPLDNPGAIGDQNTPQNYRPAAKYERVLIEILASKCAKPTPQVAAELSSLRQRASLQQVQNDFQTALTNARLYQAQGDDRTAAQLFYQARSLLPKALASEVDKAELERAKDAFEQGNFSEASGRFQKAFSRIP
jgi:hypothetical protein